MQNDRQAWLILLLLLTVLVPSVGVVWMMREAVRNERLASSQLLREAYEAQLKSAAKSVQQQWFTQIKELAEQVDITQPARSFAKLASRGRCDSVLIFDPLGKLLYPEPITSPEPPAEDESQRWFRAERLEFAEQEFDKAAEVFAAIAREVHSSVENARARQAEVRCLLKAGKQEQAISLLESLRGLNDVCDTQGRSFAATAELRLLELLSTESPRWQEIATTLTRRLNDYDGNSLSSSQRRFLMSKLQQLSSQPLKLATADAEALAAEAAPLISEGMRSHKLRETELPGVWSQADIQGRFAALYRTDTVRDKLLGLTAELPLPSGVEFAVSTRAESLEKLGDISLGENLGHWRLNLVSADGANPHDESLKQRRAVHFWIAGLIVATTFVLAWLLAQTLRRRLKLAQLKNDLVATVSHELKTPLASIRLLVDTLLEDDGKSDEATQVQTREYLELISQENSRLTRLIDNFLTFSRAEGGKQHFDFQLIDLRDVVRESASVFREHVDEGGFELGIDQGDPIYVNADFDSLVTAVVNLLENARKYSSDTKSGDKLIHLSAKQTGSRAVLAVRDNGLGLSARAAGRVFERFYQVDQRVARTQGGCGLGLSIVRAIAEAHGGEVSVESQSGVGSTFTISLPLASMGSTA
ncbi:sensor histidine kinase [Adhaeretor mobilis]|uniref:histidine kinase n=1 Tax=Adhaeretor mobilis TaxID=1930276 RepID=A0A517MR23_9BACT|nr:HAMP domain-containing sensor histidine kinase [Adhaeretor mobilis]QDS97237.1 Signal-transduction histidine kinase senX3 [Adhaeretor mobilis]